MRAIWLIVVFALASATTYVSAKAAPIVDEEYSEESSATTEEVSIPPAIQKNQVVTERTANACLDVEHENYYSELCAQWKAAQAAEKSANWTVIAFVVGTIINALTLIFVAITLKETRRTANIAFQALDSARAMMVVSNVSMQGSRIHTGLQKAIIRGNWENVGERFAIKSIIGLRVFNRSNLVAPEFVFEGGREYNHGSGEQPAYRDFHLEDQVVSELIMNTERIQLQFFCKYFDKANPFEIQEYQADFQITRFEASERQGGMHPAVAYEFNLARSGERIINSNESNKVKSWLAKLIKTSK